MTIKAFYELSGLIIPYLPVPYSMNWCYENCAQWHIKNTWCFLDKLGLDSAIENYTNVHIQEVSPDKHLENTFSFSDIKVL